jgi:hypothetical protein
VPMTNSPIVTHYPVSVIGKSGPQEEGRVVSMCHGLPINSAAHTFPYPLSAVSSEGMNQNENRKSQIADFNPPNDPIAR